MISSTDTSKPVCPWMIAFCLTFVIFCTDLKVSVVKISEIGLLLYFLLSANHNFNSNIKRILYFFVLFVFVTFIKNLFWTFDMRVADSILKQPYFCTIGRFLEVLSCLVFMQITIKAGRRYGIRYVLDRVYKCSRLFILLILALYGLELGGFDTHLNIVDEGTHRLTGFYVEGGPFGLMCAVFGLLALHLKRPKIDVVMFLGLIVLAMSKAGIVCVLGYICYRVVIRFRHNKVFRNILFIIIPLVLGGFIYAFWRIADMYLSQMLDVNTLAAYVNANDEDYNIVAGRVSGTFISYQMILDNPLLGIGIGNYPLLRNLAEYRTFFPAIRLYDASGLGGMLDILIQCGFIGLFMFLRILKRYYKMIEDKTYVVLFCLPLLFGVQYTFAYPWFMLALIIAIRENIKHANCNRLPNVG